jgi:hypothetical protein
VIVPLIFKVPIIPGVNAVTVVPVISQLRVQLEKTLAAVENVKGDIFILKEEEPIVILFPVPLFPYKQVPVVVGINIPPAEPAVLVYVIVLLLPDIVTMFTEEPVLVIGISIKLTVLPVEVTFIVLDAVPKTPLLISQVTFIVAPLVVLIVKVPPVTVPLPDGTFPVPVITVINLKKLIAVVVALVITA